MKATLNTDSKQYEEIEQSQSSTKARSIIPYLFPHPRLYLNSLFMLFELRFFRVPSTINSNEIRLVLSCIPLVISGFELVELLRATR